MTEKELRILDEMLTNLEIWSTWNKTFANEMIGICSKMRNLLADRKDEPQNCENCKHNGVKHAYDYACDKCTDMDKWECDAEPQTDCAWMKGE